MQLLAVIGIVVVLAVAWAVSSVVHIIGEHPALWALGAGLGVPGILVMLIALGKGLNKKTVRSWPKAIAPPPPRQRLPAPVELSATWTSPQLTATQAFSMEEDPATVLQPEPEQCEGPRCKRLIEGEAHTVDVTFDDPDVPDETHSFCSAWCADQWQSEDEDKRAVS